MPTLFAVHTVHIANTLRLGCDFKGLWSRHLHPVSKLKRLNPRGKPRVLPRGFQVRFVPLAKQIQLRALRGICLASCKVIDWLPLMPQPRTLENAWEKSRSPVLGIALRETTAKRIHHHDKAREAFIHRAKAVGHPGTDAWVTHAARAGVNLEEGRRVVVRFGVAGVDKRHVIHVL